MSKKRYVLRLAACATALQLVGATTGVAQRMSVTAVGASASHDLLNRPLGVMASFVLPLAPRVSAAFSVGRLRSTSDGTGVVCGGLIDPGRCSREPFTQTGRLSIVGIGADVRLATARVAEVSLQPQFLWARAESNTLGSVTGNKLFSEKGQLGFSAGLEARSFPVRQSPVGVVIGGTFGRLGPTHSELVPDGYTPFDRWYSLETLYVGGVLDWRRSRR